MPRFPFNPLSAARQWWFQAEAAWTPASLPGLAMWYDAGEQGAGLPVSTPVAQWDDLSGNARHLLQPTAGLQPTVAAPVNGLAVLNFDGADDYMRVAFGSLAQSTTVAVVAASFDRGANQFMMDGVTVRQAFYWRIGQELDIFAGAEIGTSAPIPATNTMACIVADFDGAASKTWVDGALSVTGNPGANALTGLTAGNSAGLSGPWNGRYAMLVICQPKLSDADRALLEDYISDRWGTP